VVVGDDSGSPRAGEWADEGRRVAAESGAWSSVSISSSSGERERPEAILTPAARFVDDSVDVLQGWTDREHHDMHQREGI
jgi:hypothetical protein